MRLPTLLYARQRCTQCRQLGATVSCHAEDCAAAFHFPCACPPRRSCCSVSSGGAAHLLFLENRVDLYEHRRLLGCEAHHSLGDGLRAQDNKVLAQTLVLLLSYGYVLPKSSARSD